MESPITSEIAGVVILATLQLAEVVKLGRLSVLGISASDVILYIWPPVVVGLGFVFAYVWNPSSSQFPGPEFYRAATEVIPILLLAFLLQRDTVPSLRVGHRIEYGLIFILGEAAAFLAVSSSLPRAGGEMVGGTFATTVVLSSLTATALLAAAVLVIAAVIRRVED